MADNPKATNEIIVSQKRSIHIKDWKDFSDVTIEQGTNTIYIDKDRLTELICALRKINEG